MTLALDILACARGLGFDRVGILPVGLPGTAAALEAWLAAGYAGEMAYMASTAALRADPARLAPGARSMIVVAANYGPGPTPARWGDPGFGRIARYAWPEDYHDAIKARLYELDAFIRARTGRRSLGKACVDTAPLLERDFAARAGLGFIGRNTCLITPGLGSWTVLGSLLVPEELDAGRPKEAGGFAGTCGRCTRCLEACPTGAFVAPYVLDARRCISYLTIELRGPIPRDLRPSVGNWVFGCDVCQEVCPYNRAAPAGQWAALAPHPERAVQPLLELLALTEDGFRVGFRKSALMRAKRRGLLRNACVAAGNWGHAAAVPALTALLRDGEPLVRGHAAWALGRIGGTEARRALAGAVGAEPDAWVGQELRAALDAASLQP